MCFQCTMMETNFFYSSISFNGSLMKNDLAKQDQNPAEHTLSPAIQMSSMWNYVEVILAPKVLGNSS